MSASRRQIDFFFFIGSTYTYLSVMRIEAVAALSGVEVRWRPFFLREILIEQDNSPFIGKPPEPTVARADSRENRDCLAAETQAARDLGIFGSPTFAVGTEIFWGDDRLEEAIAWQPV